VNDQTVLQVWNLETGGLLNQTPVYAEFSPDMIPSNNIVFSSDGRLLAFGTSSGLLVMDADSLENRIEIPEDSLDLIALGPTAIAISHDNRRVVAINHYHDYASDQYSTLVQVWDIQDPTTPQRIYSLPIADAFAQDAALTADGHYLAYTSRDDTTDRPIEVIHIQDLVLQKEVLALPCEPYTHIGPITLSEGFIAFQQRGLDNTGDENSLQVARWSVSTERVDFELLKKPQALRALGVTHLRLHSENGSTVIDYLALDTHMLLRWDFNSNSIRMLPL
jgi:WD40 repeat protein